MQVSQLMLLLQLLSQLPRLRRPVNAVRIVAIPGIYAVQCARSASLSRRLRDDMARPSVFADCRANDQFQAKCQIRDEPCDDGNLL